MIEILCIVVGAVVGFIIGALVYRNNAEAAEAKLAEYERKVEIAKDAVKELKQ